LFFRSISPGGGFAVKNDLKIIREVSAQAELFYDKAKDLGDHAAHVLKKGHRAQMTGLENIAESTFKTSDIFDYIKKQTARFPAWRQGLPDQTPPAVAFGELLRAYLEDELSKRRDVICGRLDIGNKTDEHKLERRRIHLLLIRQFIRHMVVQYEYSISLGEKANHASHT
jgi:hypothetical protein